MVCIGGTKTQKAACAEPSVDRTQLRCRKHAAYMRLFLPLISYARRSGFLSPLKIFLLSCGITIIKKYVFYTYGTVQKILYRYVHVRHFLDVYLYSYGNFPSPCLFLSFLIFFFFFSYMLSFFAPVFHYYVLSAVSRIQTDVYVWGVPISIKTFPTDVLSLLTFHPHVE